MLRRIVRLWSPVAGAEMALKTQFVSVYCGSL
jgi:hypothetical protein